MHRNVEKVLEGFNNPIGWISGAGAYFLPLKEVFILILLIVITDFVCGIWASRKQKVIISSRRLRKSVSKAFCYFAIIGLFHYFEIAIGSFEWLCSYKLIAGFIFMVEVISIAENMAVITEHPIFLKIVKLIRGKNSDNMIKEIIDEKNEKD